MYSLTTACILLVHSRNVLGDHLRLPNTVGWVQLVLLGTFTPSSVGLDKHEPQACKAAEDRSGAALLQSIVQAVSEHELIDNIRSTLEKTDDTRAVGNALNAASLHEEPLNDTHGSRDA